MKPDCVAKTSMNRSLKPDFHTKPDVFLNCIFLLESNRPFIYTKPPVKLHLFATVLQSGLRPGPHKYE